MRADRPARSGLTTRTSAVMQHQVRRRRCRPHRARRLRPDARANHLSLSRGVLSALIPQGEPTHLSWLDMLLNVVFRLVPIVLTAAMMATEMPAAIRPYSMAVAPLSSFRERQQASSSRGSHGG